MLICMKKSKFTLKIENRLKKTAPKKFGKFKPEDFLKGNGMETSALKFLNHSMPTLRNELSTLFPTKEESYSPELYEDMKTLWCESDIFDAKTIAVCWLDKQDVEFLKKNKKDILAWAEKIDNWAHSDGLCSVYARLFEHAQSEVLPIYLKWNKHRNSWLRRCSMVGTFYYSRNRKNQPSFDTVKNLVLPHLTAEEYYVQKGVGWTIREMYNAYPKQTLSLIKKHNTDLTSVAWVAASEKLPLKIKSPLLKLRKRHRKEKN